jgi:hypothetical protein
MIITVESRAWRFPVSKLKEEEVRAHLLSLILQKDIVPDFSLRETEMEPPILFSFPLPRPLAIRYLTLQKIRYMGPSGIRLGSS